LVGELPNIGPWDQWDYPNAADNCVLYINFTELEEYDYGPDESDPDGSNDYYQSVVVSLGRVPDVSLLAEVSGRHAGDAEVRTFVKFLLGHFRGVACDEYSVYCWTLADIETDARFDGHPFFDYNGWYEEYARRKASRSDQ
jgi:hypothetical protein